MFFNSSLLGKRIKSLREYHGLTQKELSLKIGLTPKMISFYENSQRIPPIDILFRLADIFDVSIDYLTGYKPQANIHETLSSDDVELLKYYNALSVRNKHWIMGLIIDLLKKEENIVLSPKGSIKTNSFNNSRRIL